MKKYLIAGIIYISSIFIVRAYDETRLFINIDKLHISDTALVDEYDITNMAYLTNIGYKNENLYETKYIFELNKDMTLNENVIYYKGEILGLSIKIDNKLYGEVFTVSGLYKIENNELLKYKTERELERLADLDIKKVKVKINKDKTLRSLEAEDFNYSLELFQYENLDENKIEDATYKERLYIENLDKILNDISESEEDFNSLKNAIKIKNSKVNLIIIQLLDSFRKRERLIILDLHKNKYYISDYKDVEDSYIDGLNLKVDAITDIIKRDNFIYCIHESGSISKVSIQGDKLIYYKVHEENDYIDNPKIIGDYIYLIYSDRIVSFNTKNDKVELVLKDDRKINNGVETRIIDDKYIIVSDINSNKRKSVIGKLEGDKINFILENKNFSTDYEIWCDNEFLILNNKKSLYEQYSEKLSIYNIDK